MRNLVTFLPIGRRMGVIALVAVVYFLAAAFGLSLATLSKQVSPVWPPTGVALAAMLLIDRGVWPGIAIGAVAINALNGPWTAALGIAAGNTLEAVIGAWLLQRYVGFRCAMDRPRDVVGLASYSAIVSTTIAATIGVTSLCLSGVEQWKEFKALWWTYWLGDAMGSLIVAPPLLIGITWLRAGQEMRRPLECALFVAAVSVVSSLVLGGAGGSPLELKSLVFPLFAWSALRLGQMTTATGLAISAGFVVYWIHSAVHVIDPAILNAKLLLMQSFLGVLAVGSLILGAVASERERVSAQRDALLESEQAARADAERMARQKDDFVATLSHELRTPLNGLLGWTQLLKRGGYDPAMVGEGLASIERCARALAQLMDDLLDMTRIISGKMSVRLQPMELPGVVDYAMDIIRPDALAKKIALAKNLRACPMVLGDPPRLQQALCNLLSNAVKFTPASGRVTVELGSANDHAIICVQDTGPGIEADFLPLIFDRFRQADSSSTRRYGGLGLGLAIVKHIVQLHGGTIEAQSLGAGLGSTFSIRIPLAPEGSAQELAATANALDRLSGLRIIILDDDKDACELLRRILTEHNAQVAIAHSADQALTMFFDRPQLLLSDIGLPDKDGYQLIRVIREHADPLIRNIPAIAVTAFARPEDRERALHEGFNSHVAKPVDVAELLTAISQVLHAARSSEESR